MNPAQKLVELAKRIPNPISKNEIQKAAEAKRLRKQARRIASEPKKTV